MLIRISQWSNFNVVYLVTEHFNLAETSVDWICVFGIFICVYLYMKWKSLKKYEQQNQDNQNCNVSEKFHFINNFYNKHSYAKFCSFLPFSLKESNKYCSYKQFLGLRDATHSLRKYLSVFKIMYVEYYENQTKVYLTQIQE